MSSTHEVVASRQANRDNYMHMSGEPLRAYALSMGVARSDAARLSDERLKEQIRYAISHQYEDQ
jgi:hypothetical protein